MSVQVRELPPYHVAYMRYVGPYGAHGIPELWARFDKWMEARGLRAGGASHPGRRLRRSAHHGGGAVPVRRVRRGSRRTSCPIGA